MIVKLGGSEWRDLLPLQGLKMFLKSRNCVQWIQGVERKSWGCPQIPGLSPTPALSPHPALSPNPGDVPNPRTVPSPHPELAVADVRCRECSVERLLAVNFNDAPVLDIPARGTNTN